MKMVIKNFEEKTFLSYLDSDGLLKNQYVIILELNSLGIKFKFDNIDDKVFFIPMSRVLKVKSKEVKNE